MNNPAPTDTATDQEAVWRYRARHYSPDFQNAFVRFMSTGDRSCLSTLALGLLEHHVEDLSKEWLAAHAETLNLRTDLGSDSMMLAEVAFAVEELFDVTMNNQDLVELENLNDLANLIEQKRAIN
ncbi:acyl carrier protein [Cerasicoccus fimbriatus]|uniref:acyl carrier protein n=1 Tax=Cerasicoccus fimbriatus TaxID=3014554 RepID=UPI0022B53FA0|nr:acyl carrier protein [Cerasicoccus sp. TK19100]